MTDARSTPTPESPVVWSLPAGHRPTVEQQFLAHIGERDRRSAVERSQQDPAWFWGEAIEFLRIPFLRQPERIVDLGDHMRNAAWFPGAQVNMAHACLDPWRDSPETAVIAEREDGNVTSLTGVELLAEVRKGAAVLRQAGTEPGDRVVLLQPLSLPGIITLLSVSWVGAVAVPVFSGFGVEATALRIADSGARIVVTESHVQRRGRDIDLISVARGAIAAAGSGAKLIAWGPRSADLELPTPDTWWEDSARSVEPLTEPHPTSAEDPVIIAYTSGTTGKPKGVVHSHGGLTVKLTQEAAFQLDVQPGDRLCWMTDLGWIMSAWAMVGALVNRATLVCYSGAPDYPEPNRIIEMARRHRLTALGLAPTLVRSIMASAPQGFGDDPLPDIRAFGSSGEAWTPEAWWWLFETLGHGRVPIINFTGGTEVGACFLSASLIDGIKPLSVGSACWGMAVDVWNDSGTPTGGPPGELVCTAPWPSMARTVWGDDARFTDAYFSTWTDTWRHGDRASFDAAGFWTLHGRSDDVMNVAGKRLGPVEVESAALSVTGVVQAAAVGVPDPTKGEAVALFVVLDPDVHEGVTDDLRRDVSQAIIASLGKAFAPVGIVGVADLPRTRTAKTVRRAIRAVALGEDPGDLSTVENPHALKDIPRLDR